MSQFAHNNMSNYDKERSRKYYLKNKEKRIKYNSKYYSTNKIKLNKKDKEKYEINKTKKIKQSIDNRRIRKYNITTLEYDIMLQKQNYVCLICLKKDRLNTKLCIDHNHETGKVRGLLCRSCNLAIGHLNDNPYLCQRAAGYLLTNNN